jgi:pimeloyl-ACP methyl ester carboxylesterase
MQEERIGDLVVRRAVGQPVVAPAPVLFVHGLWAHAVFLEPWVRRAAELGWDARAIELRGRNGSRPVTDLGRVGLADFAEDVRDVLRTIGPAVLVGYSMGGLAAQVVAASDPDLVRALVLACSTAPRGIVGLSAPVVARMPRYLPALVRSRAFVPTRADADAMILNGAPPRERAERYARMIEDSGRAAREIAVGAIAVDATAVRCPVLVVSAGEDRISPPSLQPKLARRYGAEQLAFPGHGHELANEPGGEEAADRILAWAADAIA